MDINQLKTEFEKDLASKINPENLKIKYLGRKQGVITRAFGELAQMPVSERQKFGPQINGLKKSIEEALANLERTAGSVGQVDLTVPAAKNPVGHLHPLTQTQNRLEEIFQSLGFSVEYGFEIENDWYNFVALNFPENHPARDMQDTFYIKQDKPPKTAKEKLLLRTHTSPMQIRFMEKHRPPFAIVVPGTVYRNEATDATHEHTIEQMEGLVVGEDISFANMVWVLDTVLKKYFGSDAKTKLLPTYFPFVEPGAELALSSPHFQNGKWIELLGCGMVHQNVFTAAGYPKNKYQGFAFGFGSIRFPLMKHGIPDIRLLRENNLQFLNQF